jgi:tetratricopeptide (TPR) repeat protein/spermidine synthase
MSAVVPYAIVFASSFCVMVVELVAGRLIAKHLGSSIYTWTSVIGVILAGLALGNYLGGRIADRRTPLRALSLLFLSASATCLVVPAVNRLVGEWVALWTLSWPARVFIHVAAVFLLPSLILGAISPIAGKMALDRGLLPGRTLGSVNAWGVIGSLLGTFLTGFYFIPAFGTAKVIWSVAFVLGAVSVLLAAGSVARWSWLGALTLGGLVQLAPWPWAVEAGVRLQLRAEPSADLICEVESAYSDIRVLASRKDGSTKLHLLLDKMMHNTIVVGAPDALEDDYIRIFRALSHAVRPESAPIRTLTIGGGAYIFPRYIERHWPGSVVDVIEIDPAVTQVARASLGLPAVTTIRSHHDDGRVFVNRLLERRRAGLEQPPYDLIYLDAFNDYSVPYQLTTVELTRGIHDLLSPDGAYMINMIDSGKAGLLLGAMVSTLEQVFPVVRVYFEGNEWSLAGSARETFVVVASPAELEFDAVVRGNPNEPGIHMISSAELAAIKSRAKGFVLTDDHAPTENFLIPVVKSSAPGLAAGALVSRGIAELNHDRLEEAAGMFEGALAIDARNALAHRYLGYVESRRGRADRAIEEYTKALRLDPGLREATVELVVLLEERGLLDEAIQTLARAVAANPRDLELRNNLGILHARRGDAAGAIRTFSELAQADPTYFEARRNLGMALLQVGDAEAAERELEAAARLRPEDESVRRALERSRALLKKDRAAAVPERNRPIPTPPGNDAAPRSLHAAHLGLAVLCA